MNLGIRRPIVYESPSGFTFDFYFRRAEPMVSLAGVTATFGFDFFRRAEPARSLTKSDL